MASSEADEDQLLKSFLAEVSEVERDNEVRSCPCWSILINASICKHKKLLQLQRFYHPPCIGAELHPGDLAEAARCRDRVAAGGAFQCPGLHHRH